MSLFTLNPRDEDGLCFVVHTYNSSPVGKLTVTSESATPIAFMIRTTKPGRYCVVPNQKSWPKPDAKKSGRRVDLSSTENVMFLLGPRKKTSYQGVAARRAACSAPWGCAHAGH